MPKKGQHHSLESRRKLSEALKGENSPNFGKHFSAETKRRMSVAQMGENHPKWKGGRYKTDKGYVEVLFPGHHSAPCNGYVFEHRLLMEAHLGRYLRPGEVVHHENGIVDDNRIENLRLFASGGEHTKYHQVKIRGGNRDEPN